MDKTPVAPPTQDELKAEQARLSRLRRRRNIALAVAGSLVVVVAVGIIVSATLLTVLQVRGTSMEPTVSEGDIIVTNRSDSFTTGDIIAFYFNNKILLKRVIAFPGDWVDISKDGVVSINGKELKEDYVDDLALGTPDITFPYQVPENNYFVLGDHRSVSIDSRSSAVGTVTKEQLIGRVMFRVWPLEHGVVVDKNKS